jgi:hypothetical protein
MIEDSELSINSHGCIDDSDEALLCTLAQSELSLARHGCCQLSFPGLPHPLSAI